MVLLIIPGKATDYFVHPERGNDRASGTSMLDPFQSLVRASAIEFQPGDRLLLAGATRLKGELRITDQHGTAEHPIEITTWKEAEEQLPAIIDCRGKAAGIVLQGCSHLLVYNIRITGNGFDPETPVEGKMRCGVMVTNGAGKSVHDITIRDVWIQDIFFENEGFERGADEVRTANGTQRYGWGIRIMSQDPVATITGIHIENCNIQHVSHTGIKLTGARQNIREVHLTNNEIRQTGGPGIQMSEVQDVYVRKNLVSHSGSNDDSRKWGRGSGLWTWGSSRVLVEHNSFLYANGPGDSAGAHIDFNCDNIILQYNVSAKNAGGFCEVLGNTYNCAYRFNVSIDDGHRIKGANGAFQEGKILWLSGYRGQRKSRKGPVNFYFYNNTIYCSDSILAKIAIDNTSSGILIANNIFCLKGGSELVLGDQYVPDPGSGVVADRVIFDRNLYLNQASWPQKSSLQDGEPVFEDPKFLNPEGMQVSGYSPTNPLLFDTPALSISPLPGDSLGLWQPMILKEDILGNDSGDTPYFGAIRPAVN